MTTAKASYLQEPVLSNALKWVTWVGAPAAYVTACIARALLASRYCDMRNLFCWRQVCTMSNNHLKFTSNNVTLANASNPYGAKKITIHYHLSLCLYCRQLSL